ncbi:MAG: hypothetical protein AAGI53_16415 [Planctomycetota bacterium]
MRIATIVIGLAVGLMCAAARSSPRIIVLGGPEHGVSYRDRLASFESVLPGGLPEWPVISDEAIADLPLQEILAWLEARYREETRRQCEAMTRSFAEEYPEHVEPECHAMLGTTVKLTALSPEQWRVLADRFVALAMSDEEFLRGRAWHVLREGLFPRPGLGPVVSSSIEDGGVCDFRHIAGWYLEISRDIAACVAYHAKIDPPESFMLHSYTLRTWQHASERDPAMLDEMLKHVHVRPTERYRPSVASVVWQTYPDLLGRDADVVDAVARALPSASDNHDLEHALVYLLMNAGSEVERAFAVLRGRPDDPAHTAIWMDQLLARHSADMDKDLLGVLVADLIETTRSLIRSPRQRLRSQGLRVAIGWGPYAAPLVDDIVEHALPPETRTSGAAVYALGRIGPEAVSAVPELAALLDGAENMERQRIRDAIWNITKAGEPSENVRYRFGPQREKALLDD